MSDSRPGRKPAGALDKKLGKSKTGRQSACSSSFLALPSSSRRLSWWGFERATAVMPCTKSYRLSGGCPSSAITVWMIFVVSAFEKPRRRRKVSRSSSLRATMRSRAALIPVMKCCGEEFAKCSSAGAA